MLRKGIYFFLFTVILFYLYRFLFFWLHEGTDSYFYWVLSDFLKTGKYWAPYPYFYSQPSTMEPPLYSAFLFFFQIFTRADIVVHLVQTLSILFSAFFAYKIMKHHVKKDFAILIAIVFLLTPAHIIYISLLVAEPIAVFMLSLYLYVLHKIIVEKKKHLISFLLIFSSVMILQRYNFIVFFMTSVIIFFMNKKKEAAGYMALFMGLGILVGWVFVNHSWNGSWGFSNSEGKHLYNRIVLFDGLLPPENSSVMKKMRQYVGGEFDFFRPWWYLEPSLMSGANYSEYQSSQLMQEFSIEALKSNPLKYILDTPGFFLYAHGFNETYHSPTHLWGGTMPSYCRTLGTIKFCSPIIDTQWSRQSWDFLVKLVDEYYLNIFKYVNYGVLFPSLLYTLIQKNKYMRICAVLYITAIGFFIMAEAPLPRYTYNFTVLKTMIMGFGIYKLLGFVRKKFTVIKSV